jgi:serine/threonine protein kinase
MTNDKGRVKIMDCGLARLKGQTGVTKAGITMGTADYMSPGQAQVVEVDHRTDIWSLGVVLYEMVPGNCPLKAITGKKSSLHWNWVRQKAAIS